MSANVEAVRGGYDALARGDVPAILAALDDNVQWTEAEGFPYAGTYVGPQAVLENVFTRLATEWEKFSAVPTDFIDGGDRVVALGRYSGVYNATGKTLDCDFAHVWTLGNGKVLGFKQYVDSALVRDVITS